MHIVIVVLASFFSLSASATTYAYSGLDSYGVLGGGGGLYAPSYGELERELVDIKDLLRDSNTQQLKLTNDDVWNEAMKTVANSSACTKDADLLIIDFMQESLNRDVGSDVSLLSPSAQQSIRESQRSTDMLKLRQMLVLRAQIAEKCVGEDTPNNANTTCPEYAYFDGEYCNCVEGYEQDPTNTRCIRKVNSNNEPSVPTTKVGLPHDVPSDAWYSNALRSFVQEGDIRDDEEFRPQDRATRGEFIQLLVDSVSIPPESLQNMNDRFDDVPGWYMLAFQKAATMGWLKGENNCYGTHPCNANPDKPINRAEAAALIFRAHNYSEAAGKGPSFPDVVPGAWYAESVRAAGYYCILQGDSTTGNVRPSDNLNRAEMVVMVDRASKGLTYPSCQ